MGEHTVLDADPDWKFEDLIKHLESGYEMPFRIERGKLNSADPLYQLVRPGDTYERYGPASTLTVGQAACVHPDGFHRDFADQDRFELTLHGIDDLLIYITDVDSQKVEATSLEREAVAASHEGFLQQVSHLYERTVEHDSERKQKHVTRGLDLEKEIDPDERKKPNIVSALWTRHFDMDPLCSKTLHDYLADKRDPHFMTVVHVRARRGLVADVGVRSGWQTLAAIAAVLVFVAFGVPGAEYGVNDFYRDAGDVGTFARDWVRERVFG